MCRLQRRQLKPRGSAGTARLPQSMPALPQAARRTLVSAEEAFCKGGHHANVDKQSDHQRQRALNAVVKHRLLQAGRGGAGWGGAGRGGAGRVTRVRAPH